MATEMELSMRLACAWLCKLSTPSAGEMTTNWDNPYLDIGRGGGRGRGWDSVVTSHHQLLHIHCTCTVYMYMYAAKKMPIHVHIQVNISQRYVHVYKARQSNYSTCTPEDSYFSYKKISCLRQDLNLLRCSVYCTDALPTGLLRQLTGQAESLKAMQVHKHLSLLHIHVHVLYMCRVAAVFSQFSKNIPKPILTYMQVELKHLVSHACTCTCISILNGVFYM